MIYAVVSFRAASLLAGLNSISRGILTALDHSCSESKPSITICLSVDFFGVNVSCAKRSCPTLKHKIRIKILIKHRILKAKIICQK